MEVSKVEVVPDQSERLRNTNPCVQQQFEEGAKQFAGAVAAFTARYKELPGEDVKELPVDVEWAVRARCDQAEMLLRVLKAKEAQAAVAPVLDAKGWRRLAGPLLRNVQYTAGD